MDKNRQIKIIWTLARDLGLDSNEVYSLVYLEVKKGSISKCTYKELARVIDRMQLFKKSNDIKTNKISKKEISKIYALAYSLKWDDNDKVNISKRVNSYCKKVTGIDVIEWLSPKQAYIVIEGLKVLNKRQGGD